MYQLIFKPRAVEMQKSAYEWYEQQKTGLGELFLTELDDSYAKLHTAPSSYGNRHAGYRQLVLKRFPFVIVFKIIKTDVVVYAVFHTSRNPKEKFRKR